MCKSKREKSKDMQELEALSYTKHDTCNSEHDGDETGIVRREILGCNGRWFIRLGR